MVSRIAEKTPAELWAELEALPEHVKGESIDGQLYVQPRPRPRHARGIGFLGHFIGGSFDYDADGPGAGGSCRSPASSSSALRGIA